MQKCIICDSNNNTLIYSSTLIKCNSCGFVTANLEISDEQLKSIYSENYFNGDEYLNYLSDKQTLQKNFSKRLEQIQTNNNSTIKINALEIGCAYGFFGELFKKKFKNANYTGIDVVSEAINYGKETFGLNLLFQDYLTFTTVEKYSHVFMWDVIEHLQHPDCFIEKISNESIKGCEIHITTGDIGALLPKIQKQKWRMIHPPTHLHYFTKNTLTLSLQKHGFEVQSITYKPIFRSVKQIFYSLFLLNKPKANFSNKVFQLIPEKWFIPLNTYDIMYIIAVKK